VLVGLIALVSGSCTASLALVVFSIIHSFMQSFIHSCNHSFIHAIIHSFMHCADLPSAACLSVH